VRAKVREGSPGGGSPWEISTPSNKQFLRSIRVTNLNGISIDSSVFQGSRTLPTDRTTTLLPCVAIRPLSLAIAALRPKKGTHDPNHVAFCLWIKHVCLKVKVTVGFLYSAAYAMTGPASFTISKMAVDWQDTLIHCKAAEKDAKLWLRKKLRLSSWRIVLSLQLLLARTTIPLSCWFSRQLSYHQPLHEHKSWLCFLK